MQRLMDYVLENVSFGGQSQALYSWPLPKQRLDTTLFRSPLTHDVKMD